MQLWPSGPGPSWRLAVSLAFPPPPPPPSLLDHPRRRQQQHPPLFPSQHRLLPPSWRMWRPADTATSMGRWLEGPTPRTTDHDCEGRMKPALEPFSGDTTHLLREILQNKEKKLREQLDNNNTMKTYCSNGEVSGQEMMAAVMRSKSSGSECNSLDNDHNSDNSDERSGEESDMESSYDQTGSEELRELEDGKLSGGGADACNGSASAGESGKTPDSKEAKRARVENIITSMRHSPQPGQTDQGGAAAPQELKRPKRKQLQPQQHGEAGRGPTDSKVRKVERMALQQTILQLQHELQVVNQKCRQLMAEELEEEEEEEEETEEEGKQLREAKENGEEAYAGELGREKDGAAVEHQNGWDAYSGRVEGGGGGSGGGGSRVLKGGESDSAGLVRPSFSFSGKENAFQHAGPFKSAFGLFSPLALQILGNTLKTELAQSLNQTVDNVVRKVMEAQKHNSHGVGIGNSGSSGLQDHCSASDAGSSNNRSNSSNASNSNGSLGAVSRMNGLDTGRESMISLSERRPELSVPFEGLGEGFSFGRSAEKLSAFEPLSRGDSELHRMPHPPVPFPSNFPYYLPTPLLPPPLYPTAEPEQTEALPLVVSTPKKPKRTKVTDTRLSPRAKNSLLQDNTPSSSHPDLDRVPVSYSHFMSHMLPTSVAIPNPSLNPDLLSAVSFRDHCFGELRPSLTHSPHMDRTSPHSPENSSQYGGTSKLDLYDSLLSETSDNSKMPMTSTLTPMHLRKAKLMFFFVRYPSSAILKIYFPDINFNKNNTAQLVKWFSNFREFYYIQMEKYARQAIAEGCKSSEDLVVTNESELYRVLNLHYNRNNQIEAPENFVAVVQATLREFFKAISGGKDTEPSWKKAIYKIIARMDDALPDYFKSPNWMEQLGEA